MKNKSNLWIGVSIGALGAILLFNLLNNNIFTRMPYSQGCSFMYTGMYGSWLVVGFIIVLIVILLMKRNEDNHAKKI